MCPWWDARSGVKMVSWSPVLTSISLWSCEAVS